MRIRPSRPDKDRAHARSRGQICREGVAERDAPPAVDMGLELEVVLRAALLHEARHSRERVLGSCVDARYAGGEGVRFPPVERRREVCVQRGEVENQEDEAVFAAVVGEGELFETVCSPFYQLCLSAMLVLSRC